MTKHSIQMDHANEDQSIELLQRQAQAEALFSSIGDGAITTDEDGRINHINQAALTILGYERKEIMGKWFPKIIVSVDESGKKVRILDRPITRAFMTGKAVSKKTRYLRKDGSIVPVSITVSPILLNDKPVGAIEVFRDITVEQEIDRMKTEFIYLASHQLRTPLTAIKTYAHMLHEGYRGDLSAEQDEFMRIIISSLDRMNEIINTLLNISRIEAGKMSVTPSEVDLRNIINQSLEELQPSIEQKGISVKKRLGRSEPLITDQLLVKEVCLNLLSNAVKYTPEGGSITVTLTPQKEAHKIAVHDTGYGIPKEARRYIFRKFYRAANIMDKAESGTGLGLYLVKGIADVLGAQVSMRSQEGKGSSFYFSLPRSSPTSHATAALPV